MTLTLQEALDIAPDWDKLCELHGINPWAVNEGGGDVQLHLTTQQAHHLGIVKLKDWKVEPVEKVYPKKA